MTIVLQSAGNREVDVLSSRRVGEEVLKVAPVEEHAIGSTVERRSAKNRNSALRLYIAGCPLVEVVRSIRCSKDHCELADIDMRIEPSRCACLDH